MFLFTEGVTDDEFIQGAFNLLRPEVAPLFKTFGFHEEAKPERSASALARLAQALTSAGFEERCLFLFDNDAAGRKCLGELSGLPSNMKAFCLPDIDSARFYPTFGPNGVEVCDLNGRGVAIEFFLGDDCLRHEDGTLMVAEWVSKEGGEYQASFSKADKEAIHERYRRALSDAKKKGLDCSCHDWEPMEALLDCLIGTASSLTPKVGQPYW